MNRRFAFLPLVVSLLVFFIVLVSCSDDSPTTPSVSSEPPNLRLVRTTAAMDSASLSIDFGDVAATKSLYYVLVNEGDLPVTGIEFVSDLAESFPSRIGTLDPVSGTLSAMPMIRLSLEYITPLSGVGGLIEPFAVGPVEGTMTLSYDWTDVDTVKTEFRDYTLAANLLLSRIEFLLDGQNVTDFASIRVSDDLMGLEFQRPVTSALLLNTGNVEVSVSLRHGFEPEGWLYDDTLSPGDTLNLSGEYWSHSQADSTAITEFDLSSSVVIDVEGHLFPGGFVTLR